MALKFNQQKFPDRVSVMKPMIQKKRECCISVRKEDLWYKAFKQMPSYNEKHHEKLSTPEEIYTQFLGPAGEQLTLHFS